MPTFYVDAIGLAEQGAWPCGLTDLYPPDGKELAGYAGLAKTAAGFADYLESLKLPARAMA